MKKGLLIASIASVMAVAGGLSFAVANANKGIRYEAAKAAEKSIVFDGTHSLPSPAGVFEAPNSYQVTSYTGAGDPVNVKTEAILPGGGAQTSYEVGGDHFMSNYFADGSSNARLITTIGLNNITALSIDYGTSINQYMSVDVYLYDEIGNQIGNAGDNTGSDIAMTKTFNVDLASLSLTEDIRKAEIWVIPFMQSDNGTYFIHSISATWSC